MTRPRWMSNYLLSETLARYEGDCSPAVYEEQLEKYREAKFEELTEHYGFDLNDPQAGWKLAAQLALEHIPGFQVETAKGHQAEPTKTIDDLILWLAVDQARTRDPSATVQDIIRKVSEANDWPTTDAAIATRRRRYFALQKDLTTGERRRALAMARRLVSIHKKDDECD